MRVVVAKASRRSGQNAQNIGLLTTTDFSVLDRIRRGEAIPVAEFTKGLPIAPPSSSTGLFTTPRASAGTSCPAVTRPRAR